MDGMDTRKQSSPGKARWWQPVQRGMARALWGGAVVLLGAQSAVAQTCQPDKLYDIIVSSFHSSVAQRTDGSWAGWGGHIEPLEKATVQTPIPTTEIR